ncbi:MAG: DUF692 family protein [Anaerolineaceae bacterium]|nr:DUF692 family protein [Anaerolineaceae bacterium]
MTKLAINYSPQASELWHAGKIDFHLYKCPNWENLIAVASNELPVYIHFDFFVGNDFLVDVDWGAIRELADATGTRYINAHLANDPNLDLSDLKQKHQSYKKIIKDIGNITRYINPYQVIIENLPHPIRNREDIRPEIDPKVFSDLIYETGVGMLLDVGHARITAASLGIDEREYISQFPLTRLSELHTTGVGEDHGLPTDHLRLLDADWSTLDWVLENIQAGNWREPEIMAFEYGGGGPLFEWRSETDVLYDQVPKLFALLGTHGLL